MIHSRPIHIFNIDVTPLRDPLSDGNVQLNLKFGGTGHKWNEDIEEEQNGQSASLKEFPNSGESIIVLF